jgi:hypothetical protein
LGQSTNDPDGVRERTTRRDALRRIFSAGIVTTAGAGLSELLLPAGSRAATPQLPQLPATMILNALPADISPNLANAIEAGCCITYTRDEHHCGSSNCPTGECCYHIVSNNCGIDEIACVAVSCAEGNFTTGC